MSFAITLSCNKETLDLDVPVGSEYAFSPELSSLIDASHSESGTTVSTNTMLRIITFDIERFPEEKVCVNIESLLLQPLPGLPYVKGRKTGGFRLRDTPEGVWMHLDTIDNRVVLVTHRNIAGRIEIIDQCNVNGNEVRDTIPFGTIQIKRRKTKNPALRFLERVKEFLNTCKESSCENVELKLG